MNDQKKKRKKTGYSCIEKKHCREYNPLKYIGRWGRSIKYAYQRIRYGYCDSDTWSIDWWFLNVIPGMLEELRDNSIGYPNEFSVAFGAESEIEVTDEDDKKSRQKWEETLSEIIFLFREANEETCTKKNPCEEEHDKINEEFMKRYGFFGDGLKTREEKEKKKKKGCFRMYTPGDLPEYKEIEKKYFEEEEKLDEYRDRCKDKGMELFKRWFWSLWD